MSTVVFGALCASISMSAGRNLLSKSISDFKFGTRGFFSVQAIIFFCGFVILIVPALVNNDGVSALTAVYALIYALLLITAQWSYTAALGSGNTAICVTIYSLGFIFPTLSGSLFWNETFTVKNMFGLIAVIMAVLVSGYQKDGGRIKAKYFFPLISAMAASGGLGIMQKVQQSSPVSNQKAAFVMIAFLIAGIISLSAALVSTENNEYTLTAKKRISASGAGICFGCCNLLNTFLAGNLNSSFFFPVQNIGTILMSLVISAIVFREKPGKKEYIVLILGICAIFLLNN